MDPVKEIEDLEAELLKATGADNKNKRNRINKRLKQLRDDNGIAAPAASSLKQSKTDAGRSVASGSASVKVSGRNGSGRESVSEKKEQGNGSSNGNEGASTKVRAPSVTIPATGPGSHVHVRLHQTSANELQLEAVTTKPAGTAILNFPDSHTHLHQSGSGFPESLSEERPADHEVEHIVFRASAAGLLKGNVEAVSYRKQSHRADGQKYFINVRILA